VSSLICLGRQVGHLSNFQKATENSPFSLRHVKRSCHWAPLHFLLWRYTSCIIVFVLYRLFGFGIQLQLKYAVQLHSIHNN